MRASKNRRAVTIAIITVVFLCGCASHAPKVDCDKRLAPINVGEMLKAAAPNQGTSRSKDRRP